MKISDDSGNSLDGVLILFNADEAKELVHAVQNLLRRRDAGDFVTRSGNIEVNPDHYHLSSADFQREVTICIRDDV